MASLAVTLGVASVLSSQAGAGIVFSSTFDATQSNLTEPSDLIRNPPPPGNLGALANAFATPFTIAPGTQPITSITWKGFYDRDPANPIPEGDFVVQFFMDRDPGNAPTLPENLGGGSPFAQFNLGCADPNNASCGVNRTNTGERAERTAIPSIGFEGYMIYEFQAAIEPEFALDPGTYWISIFDQTFEDDRHHQWVNINQDNQTNPAPLRNELGGNDINIWQDQNKGLKFWFVLEDAEIPEPGSVALLGAGLIAFGVARRRIVARDRRPS